MSPAQVPSTNMPSLNPYAAPTHANDGETLVPDATALRRLATGRKLINLCLFAWLATAPFRVLESPVAPFFILASLLAALTGAWLVTSTRRDSSMRRTLSCIAMFVPLLNMLVMYRLSAWAAKVLRTDGYTMGMFQAERGRAS